MNFVLAFVVLCFIAVSANPLPARAAADCDKLTANFTVASVQGTKRVGSGTINSDTNDRFFILPESIYEQVMTTLGGTKVGHIWGFQCNGGGSKLFTIAFAHGILLIFPQGYIDRKTELGKGLCASFIESIKIDYDYEFPQWVKSDICYLLSDERASVRVCERAELTDAQQAQVNERRLQIIASRTNQNQE